MSASTFESILDTIGGTPVVRLARIVPPSAAEVYAKLEHLSPAGSGKDRTAWAFIERAEASGQLAAGGKVVEASSGNFGIGLALVCAQRGYGLTVVVPDDATPETRATLQAYGATVETTPAEQGIRGAMARAEAIASETGAHLPRQFQAMAGAEAHASTTAAELIETIQADGGRIDAFVFGVGSGATATGVGRALKRAFPGVVGVAVEPDRSAVLSGDPARLHRIQGLGIGFPPETLDREILDRIVRVPDAAAWEMKQRLGREEGLLVGPSSGANVWAAVELAKELGPGKRVYTLCVATGERYFSVAEQFK